MRSPAELEPGAERVAEERRDPEQLVLERLEGEREVGPIAMHVIAEQEDAARHRRRPRPELHGFGHPGDHHLAIAREDLLFGLRPDALDLGGALAAAVEGVAAGAVRVLDGDGSGPT